MKTDTRLLRLIRSALTMAVLIWPNRALPAPTLGELKDYIKEHSSASGEAYRTNRDIVRNNIQSWQRTPLFNPMWRLGNRSSDMANDYRTARHDDNKDFSTLICNSSDTGYAYYHTWDDLLTDPDVEQSDDSCTLEVKYDPSDSGQKSGTCYIYIPIIDPDGAWYIYIYDILMCGLASAYIKGNNFNFLSYCLDAVSESCDGFTVEPDLVEYEWPTKTANFSNQWGQSRVTKRNLLAGSDDFAEFKTPPCAEPRDGASASPLCKLYWHLNRARHWLPNDPKNSASPRKVQQTFDVFTKSRAVTNAYKDKISPTVPDNINPFNYPSIEEFINNQPIFGLLWNPLDGSPIPTNQFLAWLQYGDGERTYARFFPERKALKAAMDSNGLPHNKITETKYFSDIRDFQLSYWLPNSRKINADIYRGHRADPSFCVRNNLATGKTKAALGRSLGWSAQAAGQDPWDFDNMRCIDDVGEIGPYAASIRRPLNTDGAFQSIAKWLQVYDHRYEHATFRPDTDHLYFPPLHPTKPLAIEPIFNRKMFGENVSGTLLGCGRFDAFAQENYKFENANSYQFDGLADTAGASFPEAGEGTAEIFTRYRGCWGLDGFEGFKTWWLTLIIPEGMTRFTRWAWQELRID